MLAPAPAWSSSLDLPSLSQSPRVTSPSLLSLHTRGASPSLLTLFDLPRAAAWSSRSPSRPPSSSLAREEELGAKLTNIHRRSRKRSEHSHNLPYLVPGIKQVNTNALDIHWFEPKMEWLCIVLCWRKKSISKLSIDNELSFKYAQLRADASFKIPHTGDKESLNRCG